MRYKVLDKVLSRSPQLFLNHFNLVIESTLFLCTKKYFHGYALQNSRLIFKFCSSFEYLMQEQNPNLIPLFHDKNVIQLIQFFFNWSTWWF